MSPINYPSLNYPINSALYRISTDSRNSQIRQKFQIIRAYVCLHKLSRPMNMARNKYSFNVQRLQIPQTIITLLSEVFGISGKI